MRERESTFCLGTGQVFGYLFVCCIVYFFTSRSYAHTWRQRTHITHPPCPLCPSIQSCTIRPPFFPSIVLLITEHTQQSVGQQIKTDTIKPRQPASQPAKTLLLTFWPICLLLLFSSLPSHFPSRTYTYPVWCLVFMIKLQR
ncbi:MAG: hypothetical protein JOS17DRAFT_244206 [Linnemannia elongata]|nr:MAG: hypothetical protein JOS17DRAFT_244206 [Linnemannia elongata]